MHVERGKRGEKAIDHAQFIAPHATYVRILAVVHTYSEHSKLYTQCYVYHPIDIIGTSICNVHVYIYT